LGNIIQTMLALRSTKHV